jgi:hypothetical protein
MVVETSVLSTFNKLTPGRILLIENTVVSRLTLLIRWGNSAKGSLYFRKNLC